MRHSQVRLWFVLRSLNAPQVSWEWLLLHLSNLFGGGAGYGGGGGGVCTCVREGDTWLRRNSPPPCLLCLTESRWRAERGRLRPRGKMSEPATNPAAEAAAATSFPAPTISLPLGLEVLRTYSGALILVEIVSGSDFFFIIIIVLFCFVV